MSKTKPQRRLYCSKCKKEYNKFYLGPHDEHHPEKYMNIEVVEEVKGSIRCRCRQCGHEYLSRSEAAYSILHSLNRGYIA